MTDPTHGQTPPDEPAAGEHDPSTEAAGPRAGTPARQRLGRGPGHHEQPHSLMLKLVRAGFFIIFITVTLLSVINVDNIQSGGGSPLTENYAVTILAAVLIGAIIVAIDVFTPRKRVAMLFAVFFALMGGLMVTGAFGLVVDLLARLYEFQRAESVVATVKVLVGICVCYLAIAIVLQTQDDFRLVIPYVEFAKQIRGVRPMLLDSSVIIDGRIHDIGRTGILQAPIIVPRFVVNELQTLADSADRMKRARGRRGLAMVSRLQRAPGLDVSIDESPVPGKAVDQMLVELARQMPATIVTSDHGLAQVASIQNVGVINLNDLASALRAPVGTGDRLPLRIERRGEQPGQGVGYLEDGTMVVVEGGADHIDQQIEVVIGTSLQTAAGRLVFAKPTGARDPGPTAGPSLDAAAQRAAEHADHEQQHITADPASDSDGPDTANTSAPDAPSPPPLRPETSQNTPSPHAVRPPRNPLGPGGRPRPTSRNPRR